MTEVLTFHMFVKVSTLLDLSRGSFWRDWKNVFVDDSGKLLSYEQVREELYDQLLKGHVYIPLGDCDNFDYVNGGCKGYPEK